MTKEEDFFKENFPEYVTEKGEFLSPYWDLFSAGVICATFELNKELGKVEGKLADLTSEYYELENFKNNEIAELKEENEELKEKLKPENCLKLLAKEGYIKFSSEQLPKAKELLKQWLQIAQKNNTRCCGFVKDTEQFLKDLEK